MSVIADIKDVAYRLGVQLRRVGGEYVGPCQKCGGRDRFAVNPRKAIWNCRGCGVGGDAIDMTRHLAGMSYAEACAFVGVENATPSAENSPLATISRGHHECPVDLEKAAYALALWRIGVDPRGTVVERYLNSRALPLDGDLAGEVLRWHAGDGAMLALFRNIRTGEPQAISRTFLTPDARKVDRKFLGPVGGAAIMLDAFDDVTHGLHIGEGVETCMSGRVVGLRPAWALGSKGAIDTFPVFGGVECLTIFTEPDAMREAEACASRWHEARRDVYLNRSVGGKDLNDALRRAA